VVAPAGTVLRVRLSQALDARRSRPGDRFTGQLESPVIAEGAEILPKGTVVYGHVVESHSPRPEEGRPVLSVTLDSCERNGRMVALTTSAVVRSNHRTLGYHRAIPGGSPEPGAMTGAGVVFTGAESGAGAGAISAAGTGGRNVSLPAEGIVSFTLRGPLAG
jgi:hypothetical protein